ncbi:MAG: MerR family transcriptional regulator [Clostridia bacterium]|nr:MerR family transcriptional regulator [Clostridia bacterium]
MTYSIKEVSERMNISAYVLRYYEKEGLLPRVSRSEGGIRRYTDADLDLLGLISCLKKTGMPLKDIRTFIQLQEQGPSTLRQRCAILEEQQRAILNSMEEMRRNCEKVQHKLERYTALLREYEKSGQGTDAAGSSPA